VAVTPFISQDDLESITGRTFTADEAAIVLDWACNAVRTAAEQTFNKVSGETIYLDGTDTDALVLPQLPVTKVSSVSVLSAPSNGTWTTAGSADWTLNGSGTLYAVDRAGTALFGACWPKGRQNVSVNYDHGYTTVPADVAGVALAFAHRLVMQGPSIFEVVGDEQVRYGTNAGDFTPGEQMILRKHMRT